MQISNLHQIQFCCNYLPLYTVNRYIEVEFDVSDKCSGRFELKLSSTDGDILIWNEDLSKNVAPKTAWLGWVG